MVPPPPPVENSTPVPTLTPSLADAIHKLHGIIFKIVLPKTKAAKMATIPIEALHLVMTAQALLLHNRREGLQLNDISKQLEVIMARLDTQNASCLPQKHSYASVLTTGTLGPTMATTPPLSLPLPRPAQCFDITLVQKSRDSLVFVNLTSNELIAKILKALREADCWLEDRPHTPDSDGNKVVDRLILYIRVVGWHRSRDIWVATSTEAR